MENLGFKLKERFEILVDDFEYELCEESKKLFVRKKCNFAIDREW